MTLLVFSRTAKDEIFSTQVEDLDFNSTYYFEAYYIYQDSFVFSSNPILVEIKDGWEKINTINNLNFAQGAAWVTDLGDAFIGFGCNGDIICQEQERNMLIYKINLETGALEADSIIIDDLLSRNDASYFSYENKLYFGLGSIPQLGGDFLLSDQFYYVDPYSSNKTPVPFGPPLPGGPRYKAFAERVDNFVYVGGGRDNSDIFFRDFYRLNLDFPDLGWQNLGELQGGLCGDPLQAVQSANMYSGVMGESIFIGGGQVTESFWVPYFVKYDIPTDTSPNGNWTMLPCPSLSVSGSGMTSFNNRLFIGTGNVQRPDLFEESTDQWREVINNSFEPRVSFPDGGLQEASIFSTSDYIYLIGGFRITFDSISGELIKTYNKALWRYSPQP